ncbi:MAG: hypothetical protein IMZ55_16350, partial [Acidobacteria bacterium]|nr:hypothetical protein [Acidobacteriota bacterium]
MKDQREVVHAYDYVANGNAGAGRLEKDCVTNNPWPATVDSHVKSVKRTFDDVGRMASVTCYSDNACTGGNERNVVQFTYDGWGSVIKSRQEHGGAVDANTPDVEYAYADGGEGDDTAEYVRLKCLEYPNGRRVHYTYPASGIGSMLSRLDEIVPDDGGSPDMTAGREYAQYTFLGAGTVVQVSHPAVDGGLTLSYKSASAGVYPGFDRFGRVRWQPWKKTDGTVLDRYFYGYDRAGNRTWRAERINPQDPGGRDEAYGYDSLHRLVKAQRGILTETGDELRAPVGGDINNDGVIDANDYGEVDKGYLFGGDEWEEGDLNGNGVVNASDYDIIDYNYLHYPSRAVSRTGQWSLDALGNWPAYKEDAGPGDEDQGDWDLEQAREHNWVNEIDTDNIHANGPDADAITEGANQADWRSPVYNAVGNMTFAPRPSDEATDVEGLVMVYDRWNR